MPKRLTAGTATRVDTSIVVAAWSDVQRRAAGRNRRLRTLPWIKYRQGKRIVDARLLDPGRAVDADELLRSRPSGQAQPRRPAFAIESHFDVEEGATEFLLRGPLHDHRDCFGVRRKLEFVAIGQLADAALDGTQRGPQLIKMPLANLR